MNFPSSPTVGQTYTLGSKTWVWNGSAWDLQSAAPNNLTLDYVQLNTSATVTDAVGRIRWDADQGTADLGLLGGNIVQRLGQTLVAYVTNAEAVTITKGQAVYLFSAVGDRASVKLAYNTADAASAKTLGLVAEDIAAGASGFVMCQGVAYKMNTAAFTAGDSLYLGATAGSLTTTKPYAPNHLVYIGTVEKANAGNGQIYVRVQNGYELDELHNVSAQSPTTGQTIVWNGSTSLWEKNTVSLTAGVNGTLPVANGGTGVTTSTGTGNNVLSASPTLTGDVTLNAQGDLRFADADSSNWVAFQAPATVAANVTWTLPSADGTSSQVLSTNGTGTLSWATVSGGGSAATPTALGTVYGLMSSGSTNTAAGYNAFSASASGANNTGFGSNALNAVTSGAQNTGIGQNSGRLITTGTNNTGVGAASLRDLTTGSDNTASGYAALLQTTTGGSNTAHGTFALAFNTTGANNVAVGYQSGYANTTGVSNVFVGPYSGYVNTVGNGLVAIGNNALVANTSGSYNVGVGQQAFAANTTGVEGTAVGYRALVANTTGDYNVAIGRDASRSSTTAQRNTSVGSYSAVGITTGSYNTSVGFDAGAGITTGVENTFMGLSAGGSGSGNGVVGIGYQAGRGGGNYGVWIGYNAGQATSNTGAHNVGLGFYAGVSNSTGSSNIFIGYQTGGSNTTGANNVFIGSEAGNATGAGMANTTASNNVAIGASALRSNTTASQNTAVGYQAGYSTTTATGQTFVGDKAGRLATGEWNTCIGLQAGENITTGVQNTMIGAYNGNYVVSLTTGSYNITLGTYSGPSASNSNYELVIGYNVRGKGSSTGFISPNGGGVYQGNNSSSWSTTSDRRLKKNIVNNDVGLEKLTQIQVRNFEYRLPEEVDPELKPTDAIQKTGVQLGVIAQELQAVLPECVKQESTGVLSVDTDNLTWYLINAVKELSARVKQLEGN